MKFHKDKITFHSLHEQLAIQAGKHKVANEHKAHKENYQKMIDDEWHKGIE